MTLDVAYAVELVLGQGVEYGSASTYEDLQRTWRDARPVPTLAELQTAWDAYDTQRQTEETLKQVMQQALRSFDFATAIAANTTTFNQLATDADLATTVNQLKRVVRDLALAQRRTNDDFLKTIRRMANLLDLNEQGD